MIIKCMFLTFPSISVDYQLINDIIAYFIAQ